MPEVATEFLAFARAFRAALIADAVEGESFAREVRDALARVYVAAALLGPPTTTEGEDPPDRPPSDYDAPRERLAARFGATTSSSRSTTRQGSSTKTHGRSSTRSRQNLRDR